MAPPTSTSADGSLRRNGSQVSRPGSIASAQTQRTNVFSDDFALDRSDSGGMSPVESIQESVDLARGAHNTSTAPQIPSIPRSTGPLGLDFSIDNDHDGPRRSDIPSVALSEAETNRTLSTSSRLTMNRPASPYNGPTAPSQPYAMYPQVTRASSVASESTVRPFERPFVSQGGPEHPYGMYQNTVPEEDDEPANAVPLGFANLAPSFAAGSSSSGNDTGDIVGSDGHVEQLPPYTRYADNVVAKGDMAQFNQGSVTEESQTPSQSPLTAESSSTEQPSLASSETAINPTQSQEQEMARKEGLYERSKKRKCCGIPLVIVILLVIVIVVSAAIGGIIGGIVGNRKGVDHARAASASTSTVWLDADPVETGPATPSCPTGHYTIPLANNGLVEKCVTNAALMDSWSCQAQANLGITILEEGPSGAKQLTITFDDYSLYPKWFEYGPQPPDFNYTKFILQPVEDIDNRDYGVAMFFSHLFDKLIILEADALNPTKFTRRDNTRRQQSKNYLSKGDQPWYCYWNQTVEEFWIFLEKDIGGSSASGTVSAAAAMTGMASGYPRSATTASPSTSSSITSATATVGEFYAKGYPPPPPDPTGDWYGPKARRKRSSDSDPYPSEGSQPSFTKMVKMVEKRKPFGNVAPYCQQMRVLDDWTIVPQEGVPVVPIDEEEYYEYANIQPSGYSKRSPVRNEGLLAKRDEEVIIGDLESLCICEWRTGG